LFFTSTKIELKSRKN